MRASSSKEGQVYDLPGPLKRVRSLCNQEQILHTLSDGYLELVRVDDSPEGLVTAKGT